MSRDNWETPMAVYLAMDHEFDFNGDMCASDSNAKHPFYITEAEDALSPATIERVINHIPSGNYVWINPPYSNTTPWVGLAIQLQARGIGSVVLAMDDSSVGWYWDALQRSNEIREVVKGRIAFINAETGKPVSGNNKGSKFLIFDPYGRQSPPRRTYIERDQLMLEGAELMATPEPLFTPDRSPLPELQSEEPPEVAEKPPESTEKPQEVAEKPPELTGINVGTIGSIDKSPNLDWGERAKQQVDDSYLANAEPDLDLEPQTEFTPEELHQKYWSGELSADSLYGLITFLVGMFGRRDKYNIKQVQIASVAAAGSSIAIDGLDKRQTATYQVVSRVLEFEGFEGPEEQVAAAEAIINEDAKRLAETGNQRQLSRKDIRWVIRNLPKGRKVKHQQPQAETNEA